MRAPLRNLFSEVLHRKVLTSFSCNIKAAECYSGHAPEGVTISRQLVRYWRQLYAEDTTPAKVIKQLKAERVIKAAEPLGKGGRFRPSREYARILVMPDWHSPYQHQDSLDFMRMVRDEYQPELVVNLGDEVDNHAMSFHDSDPDLMSAGDELAKSQKDIADLAKVFPKMLLCDSNHGSMKNRKAKAHGFPAAMIKGYRDVLFPNGGGKGWKWAENWRVRTALGDVLFKHQPSGPILTDAAHNQCNEVVGHHHGKFQIEYAASSARLYWGMFAGCLIDKDSLAYAYGKHTLYKPILGCATITNGVPKLIPMLLNSAGRWVGHL